MKHFKVGYNTIGQDLTFLPDLIKADTPQKAIEYAKYYLETSEGVSKEELDKLAFVTLLLGADLETWLRKAVDRIIFLCQRRNLDLLFFTKEENPHGLGNANEIRAILGEYVTFLKHMGYTLEFTVNFDTSCYDAFTIVDSKTGELIFVCDEL